MLSNKLSNLWHTNNYQQQKGKIPFTLCHDKKINKIGSVVVGFVLEKYNVSRQLHWDIVDMGVSVMCVTAEVFHLSLFLWGGLIYDGVVGILMV